MHPHLYIYCTCSALPSLGRAGASVTAVTIQPAADISKAYDARRILHDGDIVVEKVLC